MAKVFGQRSGYLIEMEQLNRIAAASIGVILFILILAYFSLNFSKQQSLIAAFFIIAIYAAAFYCIQKKGDAYILEFKNYLQGRNGEYSVCDELEKLPKEYSIFRNIRFENRGDIDLVVSGPTGVFAIEVKSHKGNLYYSAKSQTLERNHKPLEKNVIGQAKAGALNLKAYLSKVEGLKNLFVDAVLVFSAEKAELCFSSAVASHLQIVKKESLNNMILCSGAMLSEEQLSFVNGKLLELVR